LGFGKGKNTTSPDNLSGYHVSDLLTPWAHRLLFDGTAHTVTVAMMCDWTMAILWEGPAKGQFHSAVFLLTEMFY